MVQVRARAAALKLYRSCSVCIVRNQTRLRNTKHQTFVWSTQTIKNVHIIIIHSLIYLFIFLFRRKVYTTSLYDNCLCHNRTRVQCFSFSSLSSVHPAVSGESAIPAQRTTPALVSPSVVDRRTAAFQTSVGKQCNSNLCLNATLQSI